LRVDKRDNTRFKQAAGYKLSAACRFSVGSLGCGDPSGLGGPLDYLIEGAITCI